MPVAEYTLTASVHVCLSLTTFHVSTAKIEMRWPLQLCVCVKQRAKQRKKGRAVQDVPAWHMQIG